MLSLHFKKSCNEKENYQNQQHTAGLVEVDSAWEGDKADFVDCAEDRRRQEVGNSLNAAHQGAHLAKISLWDRLREQRPDDSGHLGSHHPKHIA